MRISKDELDAYVARGQMTKREQLARALCKLDSRIVGDRGGCDCQSCTNAPTYFRQVDAILAELREPDEKMHAAGEQAIRHKKGNETGVVPIETEIAFDVWQAMIDAIE